MKYERESRKTKAIKAKIVTERTPLIPPTQVRLGNEQLLVFERKGDIPPSLQFIGGKRTEVNVITGEQVIPLGRRERDNVVVIPDETVSRIHAKITREAGTLTIEDLGSKNSTVIEPVAACEEGTFTLPENDWYMIPQDRTTRIVFGNAKAAIQSRAGLSFLDMQYQSPDMTVPSTVTDVFLEPDTPVHIHGGRRTQFGKDILIYDETVSRNQATMVATTEGILIRDNGSTNGTIVTSETLPPEQQTPQARNVRYLKESLPWFLAHQTQKHPTGESRVPFYINKKSGEIALISNNIRGSAEQQPNLVEGVFQVVSDDHGETTIDRIVLSPLRESPQKTITALSADAKTALEQTIELWNNPHEEPTVTTK